MVDSTDRRIPWRLPVLLGVACAALGTYLVFRPFDSLSVLRAAVIVGCALTGVATLAAGRSESRSWTALLGGALWIVAAAVVLLWPAITTAALAAVVGISLVIGGVVEAIGGLRGSTDERVAAVIGGIASVVFGVLALGWPSITLLVVAIVFGARLVLLGLRLAWWGIRNRSGHESSPRPPAERGVVRRFGRVLGAVVALVVALSLAAISSVLHEGEPALDAFYDTPDEVPSDPGQLLRAEPFTRTIPDDARAWRILYTTTRADGVPAVASALVVEPKAPASEPRPVIALAHGTTGVDRSCAPSALADPFAAGAFFALDRVINEEWTLVATDYVGLGADDRHPYLVGETAGRSVLDSVRAAKQLPDLQVSDQTVVWGHSQGGGAALWTGVLAPSYAPDANVIGVAALAPASDLVGLVTNLSEVTAGSIFAAYVLKGYSSAYDDVAIDDYVRPAARSSFDAVVGRCLAEPSALLSVLGSVALGDEIFSKDLSSGPLLDRLQENVPTGPIEAPLLLAQGAADQLVVPSVQTDYVAARCADGQAIDYRTYDGLDHVPLVEASSPLIPDLLEWTEQRLAGEAPTPNCPG